ncbi:MAG: SEL1-like repeat protein, partial [Alphaproteobacteria bacterium]|nr:SEL1-like repeat protein [Alphaproteobacteria bacterium]
MQGTTKAGAKMTMESVALHLEANSAREAIVAAARRLAERDGTEALTREAVGEEAGCTPEAVRAHFADDGELQLAVVADDMAELAALMRAGTESKADLAADDLSPPPADQELSLKDIQQAIGVVLADAPGDFEQDFAADTDEVPDAFPDDAVAELETQTAQPSKLRKREETPPSGTQEPLSIASSIADLERNMARLEARPVDAWLERRLRVFERTLADIEARMEKVEHDSAASIAAASEGFKALEERVEAAIASVTARADDSDQRQGELRLYTNDLSRRLSLVEARRENDPGESPAPVVPAVWENDDVSEAPPATDDEVGAADSVPVEAGTENYLAAARRAAKSAAAAAAKPKRSRFDALRFPSKVVLSLSRRTMRLVVSVLGLAVVLLAAGAMLKGQAAAPAFAAVAPQGALLSPDARVVALARAHDPRAALIVGLKFLNGDGVASDLPSAVHWLGVAAKGHEPVAEYWLGTLYERGLGVAKDRGRAMQSYEAAAKAGNVKAMYRLGVAEVEGWNGEPDYVEGARWFQAAAGLGTVNAEYNLAVLYERGQGVVQSFSRAFTWYAIAAAQGDAGSKAQLDAVAS